MLPHIHDVMLLLHRARGSVEAYIFDDWIYCYVQLVLEGKQYLDWVELIADSMREQLSMAKQFKQNFFMSSYLLYCLVCVKELVGIPKQLTEEDVPVYEFYPILQKDKALQDFRRVHNAFLGDLCHELKNMKAKRISEDTQTLIKRFGSFYIQFPCFCYIRIGDFEEEPFNLPHFCSDCFILAKICKQLTYVIKKEQPRDKWEGHFPIQLGKLSYSSMSNALSIGADLRNFNVSLYPERKGFDNKGFSRSLGLMPYLPMPQLEDFWEDCSDELEVFKKENMRMVLEQVVSLQVKLDTKGLEEDYLELFKLGYLARAEIEMPPIDWDEEEKDDI